MTPHPAPLRRRFLAAGVVLAPLVFGTTAADAGELDPSQRKWYEKYKTQPNAPDPAAMRLNTDPEPELTEGFVDLFNGRDLTGWTALGGTCTFEADGDEVVGRSTPRSESTYLCTDDDTWTDFVVTCETFWEVDGNSGLLFRARTRPRENAGENPAPVDIEVYGPQVELEGFDGFAKGRGWSGAAYGQDCGGYFYPLWLKEHAAARAALKRGEWNRMTLHAQGNVIRTWVNGVPAAYWVDDGSYPSGMLGFQVHKGKKAVIRWRNVKAKRLGGIDPADFKPDPAAAE